MNDVDVDTIIKERNQDDYLDTYVDWYGEKKLIRELYKEAKIPRCGSHGDENPMMVYNKETKAWECRHPDCGNELITGMNKEKLLVKVANFINDQGYTTTEDVIEHLEDRFDEYLEYEYVMDLCKECARENMIGYWNDPCGEGMVTGDGKRGGVVNE